MDNFDERWNLWKHEQKITSKQHVDNFYNTHWQKLFNINTELFGNFSSAVTFQPMIDYLGAAKTQPIIDYEAHLMDNYEKIETKEDYVNVWNCTENMERARLVPRHVIPNKSMFDFLTSFTKEYKTIDAYKLFEPQKNTPIDTDTILKETGDLLDVKFKRCITFDYTWGWHWFRSWNYVWNKHFPLSINFKTMATYTTTTWFKSWRQFMYMDKYYIYENERFLSELYLKIGDGFNKTIPIRPKQDNKHAINYIESPSDARLAHELVHAVHYSFVPFYDVHKSIVEIPSMFVERLFRNYYDCQFSSNFIRKQVGLALADLISNNPDDFNKNYEAYAKVKNAGHIAARFWHYSNYVGVYYSYVIGLVIPKLSPYEAVRSTSYLENIVNNISMDKGSRRAKKEICIDD